MTQEEKKLLLKDLCARGPHGVICQFIWTFSNETTNENVITKGDDIIKCIDICTEEIQANYYGEWVDLEHCKPYLRPMSSMTEEETDRMWEIYESGPAAESSVAVTEYLYGRYLDCHHLIEKGFALEAPEDMYKTE